MQQAVSGMTKLGAPALQISGLNIWTRCEAMSAKILIFQQPSSRKLVHDPDWFYWGGLALLAANWLCVMLAMLFWL